MPHVTELNTKSLELSFALAETARLAALMGAGQTPLIQGILREGLVGPLEDRLENPIRAAAQLKEPLVEEQAADLLGLLLQQEGDRRVIRGDDKGVRLLFQATNAGYGWIRLFRVEASEGHPYRAKIAAYMERFAAFLAEKPSSLLYGMVGLPIGPTLTLEAIREHLQETRWASGHWMAAAYLPEKAGFVPLGLAHTVFQQAVAGQAVVPRGSELDAALIEEPDADLLPARGHARNLGALWGGEAMVEAVSMALKGSVRLDIQWTPVPYEDVSAPLNHLHASPFWSAELGEHAEASLMGVILPRTTGRILVAFEEAKDEEEEGGVGVGLLDPAAEEVLVQVYGAVKSPGGQLILPKAKIGKVLADGLPIWNRLLRIAESMR